MSIFNAPTFYSAPDRQTYSSGNFFIPQEKYTFGGMPRQVIPTGGITATTTANVLPRILPINQGDGGDGGSIFNTTRTNPAFDYEYDALGQLDNPDNVGLTEEEQEALNNLRNPNTTKGMLGTTAGMMLGFLDPFTAMASLKYQRDRQQKQLEQEAREAAQQADFDRAMAQGQDFYDSLNEGRGASVSQESREQAGAGYSRSDDSFTSSPFAEGGLVDLVDIYD